MIAFYEEVQQPLQALLVAGNSLREKILYDISNCAIIKNHVAFRENTNILLGCNRLNWCIIRQLIKVTHTKMGKLTDLNAQKSGFNSISEVKKVFKERLNVTDESPITLLEWE